MPDMPTDPTDQVSNPAQQAPADQQSASSSASAPPASQAPPTAPQGQQQAPQQAPVQAQPDSQMGQSTTTTPQQGMVSNPAPAPTTVPPGTSNPDHPSVKRASILSSIATALAGGPRYTVSIDATTGATTRTQVPVSGKQVGLAIALEALAGGLTGLGQSGPGATGKAGAAGLAQGTAIAQQRQQAQQAAEQQAAQDAKTKSDAYLRSATIAHVNAQTIAAVSEAEQRGADAIDKLAQINRQSGILDISPDLLDNGGQPLTQQELVARMQLPADAPGALNSTDSLGPVAGRTEVTARDGTKHWESTHLVLRDPNASITLTPEQYLLFSQSGVPGFPRQSAPTAPTQIPLRMMASANEALASHYLADERVKDLRTTLAGTPMESQVPTSIDFSKPGVATAMSRFRYYVSHNASNLEDPYVALQAMGADRRDAKTGEMQPNPDARYVDIAAQAMGGWPVLSAAHDQILANRKNAETFSIIDSEAKAEAVLSAPKRFSADQVSAAHNYVNLVKTIGDTKAASEVRARAVAEGKDIEAMYRFGKNPITGEVLNLTNAPPSMLVDSSGNVIPQDMVSTYKPTAQQRQTADTAKQVLAIAAGLRQAITTNPALAGPLSGRSKQGLAKLGLGDAQAQMYLDDLSFLQTASTKMHTGRFSNQILDKMGELIKPGMNPSQFGGALDSITGVAQRYSDEDKLTTVSDFKAQQAQTSRIAAQQSAANAGVPPGGIAARDRSGAVVGYKLYGQYVALPLGAK